MSDPQHARRTAIVALLLVIVVAAASFRPLHDALAAWSTRGAVFIEAHSVAGAIVFTLLSILSAMLAFFSTAVLIPVAVTAWGRAVTFALLWIGWMLGGVTSWAIGRFFGRAAVIRFIPAEKLDQYAGDIRHLVGFPQLLLLQLALPSEIPGYVTGMLGFRARTYFAALALAELPFAAGAVLLGESFLSGRIGYMFAAGAAGIAITWSAAIALRRRTRLRPHAHPGPSSLPAGDGAGCGDARAARS